jgi:ferredoxin
MSIKSSNHFESYLQNFSEGQWQTAIESLFQSIHDVDRNAVQIWFRFYPLSLSQYLSQAEDPDEAKRNLAMQGDFGLEDKIDTSHYFLYGHRYWKAVKAAIEAESQVFERGNIDLAEEIDQVAAMIAEKVKADKSLLVGITAVGFMTVAQVGIDKFKAASGEVEKASGLLKRSPEAIVASRKQDDSQGLFGFLKTVDKKFSVIHDEVQNARFDIMNDQEIASASANDRSQNWQEKDPRCWEGPVPVECTSASCGTCWVGVIAGNEKLSEVARRERRALKVFGYDQSDDTKPLIRLACQAKAYGNVTLVIPPWNAVFGKKVYGNVEELDLEPVTSSAKALREAVREAVASETSD